MRATHYIAITVALAVTAGLYWGANTVPPAKPVTAANGSAPMAGGAMSAMGPTITPASTDSILQASRKALPEHARGELAAAEKNLAAIRDSSQMASSFEAISIVWQEHKQYPAAAYYKALAAKLENSEKNLNFAGQIFLDLLHRTDGSPSVQLWEAQQAVQCFSRALELNPKSDSSKVSLAISYIEGTGETMQGVQLLLGLTREQPKHIPANLILGRLAIQSGQWDKAVGRYTTVVEQEPENSEAVYFLAEAYKGKGDKRKAIELFEKSKQIVGNPDFSKEIDEYIKTFK